MATSEKQHEYYPPMDMPEQVVRPMSYREKQLRESFIAEYMLDFDVIGAACRIGYNKSMAKEYGPRLFEESYVQQEISKRTSAAKPSEEDEEAVKKRVMAMLMREANDRGPGSTQAARVAALGKLAQLMGMEPAKTNINQHTGPNGEPLQAAGQFVIPGVMTPEQWAEAARLQQEALTNGTFKQVAQVTPPTVE